MKEHVKDISPAESIPPAAHGGAQNGTGVDLAGYESATAFIHTAEASGVIFGLEHSDDDGDTDAYADVPAAQMVDGAPTVEPAAIGVYRLGYIGLKRWVRVTSDAAGTYSAFIARGHARKAPV